MTTGRNRSIFAAAVLALSFTVPLLASAEPQSRIVGTVADFHGKYGLVVRDQRGALTEITLHQGTVIKPEGLRLERGMAVSIAGQAADRTFAAAEIVAPFAQWPTARAAAFAAAAATRRQGEHQMPHTGSRRTGAAIPADGRKVPTSSACPRSASRSTRTDRGGRLGERAERGHRAQLLGRSRGG